jgi:hypothetical protein
MAVKKREIPKPPGAKSGPASPKTAASKRPPAAPKAPPKPAKDFKIESGEVEGAGKKIHIYADSGMGKTTLASLAPTPVFVGLDNGGVGIVDYRRVGDVEDFDDVRAALQADIYGDYETVVLDTSTIMEEWAGKHVCENIPNDKGSKMSSLVGYGWNNGFRHLYDTMKLVLQDCDALIRKGKNVIIISQAAPHSVANPGGEDFIREGPRLCGRKGANIEALYCEWADHLFRIGYNFVSVDDKKASGSNDRSIFVHPEIHFRAKSRTLGMDKAVVTFSSPEDDSIWQFLFEE